MSAIRGAAFWGFGRIWGGGLRGWTSLRGVPLTETVVRGLWKRGIPLYGSSVRGTWRGAPLLGALKVIKGRLWGWSSLFIGAQLGNLEWAHLPGTLRYG